MKVCQFHSQFTEKLLLPKFDFNADLSPYLLFNADFQKLNAEIPFISYLKLCICIIWHHLSSAMKKPVFW